MTSTTGGTKRRRTVLKLLGAAAGAGALGSVVHASAPRSDSERSYVVEQGDRCVELAPLSGEEPVESFYDYRYPTALYDSVSGSNGYTFSSAGTTDLQRDATSILFLYDGPQGLSLVVVHGRLEGDDDGGIVTFTFDGMPADASWVVRDDYYLVDDEPADTNFDRWDVDGSVQQVDWVYKGGRTDGGAALGLGEEFEFSIAPAFNDEAALADDHDRGSIEDWDVLTWNGGSPDRVSLLMDEPITIRTGTCGDSTDDGPVETPDGEPVDTPDDEPTDTPADQPTDTPDDEPIDTPDGEDGGTGEEDGKQGC